MSNLAEEINKPHPNPYLEKLKQGGIVSPELKKEKVLNVKPVIGEKTTNEEMQAQLQGIEEAVARYKNLALRVDTGRGALSMTDEAVQTQRERIAIEIEGQLQIIDSLSEGYKEKISVAKEGSLEQVQCVNFLKKLEEKKTSFESIKERVMEGAV